MMRGLAILVLSCGVAAGSGAWGVGADGANRTLGAHPNAVRPTPHGADFEVVALPVGLRGGMSGIWIENNRHWDELADVNTLTQLLGTGRPTQLEYLGCLTGEVVRDTLWVRQVFPAMDLKQLQFAVAGNCDGVDEFVGTWHTHPYRADSTGQAIKERGLSDMDLATFAAAQDLVAMVMWDLDSLDAAGKAPDGSVRYPVPLTVR